MSRPLSVPPPVQPGIAAALSRAEATIAQQAAALARSEELVRVQADEIRRLRAELDRRSQGGFFPASTGQG